MFIVAAALFVLALVLIIVGILATIFIPTFLGQRSIAHDGAAMTDLRLGVTRMEGYGARTAPAYDFDGGAAMAVELGRVEPGVTWAQGAAAPAAPGILNVTGTGAAPGTRGTYSVYVRSDLGASFRADANAAGEVAYFKAEPGTTAYGFFRP